MSLAASVSTRACKQVKSALFQTELSKPARQVEILPLSESQGRTSPATPPTIVPETKLSENDINNK